MSISLSKGPVRRIACIGEAMLELSIAQDLSARIGFAGDTLNTAIYLKRCCGDAASVDYVSVLGADPFSARMRDFIAAERVGTGTIGTSQERLPGLYAISIGDGGERSFHYWRENSAARTLFQPGSGTGLEMLAGFDLVYFSAITLAILPQQWRAAFLDYLVRWRNKDRHVAFDSNYRPRLWAHGGEAREWIARAHAIADIVLPSMDDEMAVFGDASEDATLARLKAVCPGIGALKRGANGPVAIGEATGHQRFPAVTDVVDTTAAGDSFNGAFLAGLVRGKSLSAAMRDGHVLASAVVRHRGAIIPASAMPGLD